jgi:pyridoxamine 5'-phosphate oxidase
MPEQIAPDFLPDVLPANPLVVAAEWLEEATRAATQPNPNAMTIATIGQDGQPSARVVLCKDLEPEPGYLDFYTNYRSRKAREIDATGRVAVVFHWDAMSRQVRLEGRIVRVPPDVSDRYFASRPRASQLGAWASDQSEPIDSRAALLSQAMARAAELGIDDLESAAPEDVVIPRPPHWGGYRIWPDACELWVEGAGRVHDRARWERRVQRDGAEDFSASGWKGTRLQP